MSILESKTGKAPKKGSGSGRPKRVITPKDIRGVDEETIAEIINQWNDIVNDKDTSDEIKERAKKIIEKSRSSTRSLSKVTPWSKSYICSIKNKKYGHNEDLVKKNLKKYIVIFFNSHGKGVGRYKVWNYLIKTKWNNEVLLSERTIGNWMRDWGLFCESRKRKNKKPESKDTKTLCPNIVERDYNNEHNDNLIIAHDVTYIRAPLSYGQDYIYLSAAISHKTKLVISFNLSETNDVKYIIDHIAELNLPPKTVIHTDRGAQYFSFEYKKLLAKNDYQQSASRVGNSLDNREIEHFFDILKNEYLYQIDYRLMSKDEFAFLIGTSIWHYNNIRPMVQFSGRSPSGQAFIISSKEMQTNNFVTF